MLLAACGSQAGSDPQSAGPSAASASASQSGYRYGDFDIGDGRLLRVECYGDASPTILLESGDEAGITQWGAVMADLPDVSRTCTYDRAGVGLSSEATGCRGLSDLTGDLERLLEVADIGGPYVLVATSGGGFIAAEFAREHADEIAGIVFLDVPGLTDPPPSFPPDLVERLACDHPLNIERREYLDVEREAWDARAEIGDIPVTIVSNDYGPDAVGEEAGNVEAQQGWMVLSPRATQVTVASGHDIPYEEPELVVDEVRAVVEAAREP
jgi:pimeloyl-ACP methyl ester carboxylesterase